MKRQLILGIVAILAIVSNISILKYGPALEPIREDHVRFEMTEALPPLKRMTHRIQTQIVMFVPSAIASHTRRKYVQREFTREKWPMNTAILLFIFGNGTLSHTLRTSPTTVQIHECADTGDAFDRTDDTSATTCKVYMALRHITSHYKARYVWRGADDSYVNLRYFVHTLMPTLPTSRLYYGRLRTAHTLHSDLLLSSQPRLASLFGLYQFGQYMVGSGYLLSFDVAEFIASLTIPPHLTWCEDVMVGMWLNPFQITFMPSPHFIDQPDEQALQNTDYIVIHRIRPDQWGRIGNDGRLTRS